MEAVMHFVVLKAFPDSASLMKLCWPIVEKTQARDFRKLVTDKLIHLQKEHEIPSNPMVRSTLMDSPSGPKFLAILFHTVQAAMRRGLSAMKQPMTSLAPFNGKDGPSLQRLARIHASRERKRFLSRVGEISAAHEQWQSFAVRTAGAYESALQERELVKREMEQLMASPHAHVLSSTAETARQERVEDVRKWWKTVDGYLAGMTERIETVEQILLNEASRPCIDIEKLKVTVFFLLIFESVHVIFSWRSASSAALKRTAPYQSIS
jgi:hypothetical protein